MSEFSSALNTGCLQADKGLHRVIFNGSNSNKKSHENLQNIASFLCSALFRYVFAGIYMQFWRFLALG